MSQTILEDDVFGIAETLKLFDDGFGFNAGPELGGDTELGLGINAGPELGGDTELVLGVNARPETRCEVFGGGTDAELPDSDERGPPRYDNDNATLGVIEMHERPKQQWEIPPEVRACLAKSAAQGRAQVSQDQARQGPTRAAARARILELLGCLEFYAACIAGWARAPEASNRRATLETFCIKVVKLSSHFDDIDVYRMAEEKLPDVLYHLEKKVDQITRDFRALAPKPYLIGDSKYQRLFKEDIEEYDGNADDSVHDSAQVKKEIVKYEVKQEIIEQPGPGRRAQASSRGIKRQLDQDVKHEQSGPGRASAPSRGQLPMQWDME